MTQSSIAPDIASGSPVRLQAVSAEGQPEVTPALEELYRGFERNCSYRCGPRSAT
jgi:gentisate 1,2-dioxygenase